MGRVSNSNHQPIRATSITQPDGSFSFHQLPRLRYALSVTVNGTRIAYPDPVDLTSPQVDVLLTLTGDAVLSVEPLANVQETTGGVELSSQSVSQLPLNKRDFSQLLLLAAGTMTDTNGATNFTQQFAINGQRGVEATFAMDGADISDPEMGGTTFTNFNVDAIQELQSQLRLDAGRDRPRRFRLHQHRHPLRQQRIPRLLLRVPAQLRPRRAQLLRPPLHRQIPGRIPPFRRNEFGFTNGGPVILPHIYDGRGKTFYFGQYQGFRQVLGTTQVLPVPTAQERAGLDTTAFPGDTLPVPVDPGIAAVLARYPLPNDPAGPFGIHTYATPSTVNTDADQFSIRLDHQFCVK